MGVDFEAIEAVGKACHRAPALAAAHHRQFVAVAGRERHAVGQAHADGFGTGVGTALVESRHEVFVEPEVAVGYHFKAIIHCEHALQTGGVVFQAYGSIARIAAQEQKAEALLLLCTVLLVEIKVAHAPALVAHEGGNHVVLRGCGHQGGAERHRPHHAALVGCHVGSLPSGALVRALPLHRPAGCCGLRAFGQSASRGRLRRFGRGGRFGVVRSACRCRKERQGKQQGIIEMFCQTEIHCLISLNEWLSPLYVIVAI